MRHLETLLVVLFHAEYAVVSTHRFKHKAASAAFVNAKLDAYPVLLPGEDMQKHVVGKVISLAKFL